MVLAVTDGDGSCTPLHGAQSRAVRIVSVNMCVSSETEKKKCQTCYLRSFHPRVHTSDSN